MSHLGQHLGQHIGEQLGSSGAVAPQPVLVFDEVYADAFPMSPSADMLDLAPYADVASMLQLIEYKQPTADNHAFGIAIPILDDIEVIDHIDVEICDLTPGICISTEPS